MYFTERYGYVYRESARFVDPNKHQAINDKYRRERSALEEDCLTLLDDSQHVLFGGAAKPEWSRLHFGIEMEDLARAHHLRSVARNMLFRRGAIDKPGKSEPSIKALFYNSGEHSATPAKPI